MVKSKKANEGKSDQQITQPKAKVRSRSVPMYCHCLADPEGSPACRVPDDYVLPTVAQKLVQDYAIVVPASGNNWGIISPSLSRNFYTAPVDSSGIVGVSTYAPHKDYAALVGEFTWGRMVTYQVSISYIGPQQTAAGRICIISESNSSAYAAGTDINNMFDDDFSGPACDGAFMRVRPRCAQQPDQLVNSAWCTPAFDYVYWATTGLPVGTNLMLRVTKHVELVPQRKSIWQGSAETEPFHPGVMAQAANMGPAGTRGAIIEKSAKTTQAHSAARAAWDYVKSDVMEVGGYVASAAYEAAKPLLLTAMAAA